MSIFKPAHFQIDDNAEVAVTVVDRRPFQVRWMERHYKHTQMFIPLSGKPFVAVLAPPTDKDLPDRRTPAPSRSMAMADSR